MASSGSRPSGLAQLGYLNILFGGVGLIAIALMVANPDTIEAMAERSENEQLLYVTGFLYVVSMVLLFVSGIGFLKQKRFLGWMLGNGYAVISLASTIFDVTVVSKQFHLFVIVSMIYPLMLLFLLNAIFRLDFENP